MSESQEFAPKIKRALISVFKKDGVAELARTLSAAGVEILSTGGTAKLLRAEGLEVIDVSQVTEFPEMMDGRVKTLHPRVHGGLLMRRDLESHREAAAQNQIPEIDLVVVNLYPFGEVIAKPDVEDADAIEMIDIGGPSMVRSAAKNHAFVSVLTDPSDYADFMATFVEQDGCTSFDQRRRWARKAFATTSAYDLAIQNYLGGDELLPETLQLSFDRLDSLRYGENPHQDAAVYRGKKPQQGVVAWSKQHSGKELSFNNYLDADAAFECVKSLAGVACAIIKHKNPCGASSRADQQKAFVDALAGDPLSAYGGIVAFNQPLAAATAKLMATKEHFFEVVIAPGYEPEAIEILQTGAKWGKNCRILETDPIQVGHDNIDEPELRWIRGGLLVEQPDASMGVKLETVTERAPEAAELEDLKFAWALVRHVTSNAIVFVKDCAIVGVGAGQMSRVDAVELASRKGGEKCQGAVMASDAFFPFADGILAANDAGVRAVVQPGGSIRDKKVVAACNERGMAMVLTGKRHFRH